MEKNQFKKVKMYLSKNVFRKVEGRWKEGGRKVEGRRKIRNIFSNHIYYQYHLNYRHQQF